MNIAVFNVGSSSVKFSIYNKSTRIFHKTYEKVFTKEDRTKCILNILNDIEGIKLKAIGHRIVHGKYISKSCLLDKKTIEKIQEAAILAPLHNIPELEIIELCKKHFNIKQYGVFDTSFYHDIPEVAKKYAIPKSWSNMGIIRYGFHGTSHRYVSKGIKGKVITCHLGNGASITAIKNGKAIDTSMGFTPLEGLMMGTRSGTIDASIVQYLNTNGYTIDEIFNTLNKKSGLLGVSNNKSNDVRTLIQSNDQDSNLAIDMFCYYVTKTIGSYIAALNGVDTIVFCAGIGENEYHIRKRICKNFKFMGLKIDNSKNISSSQIISTKDSKIKVMVIPTNEELMIAKDVLKLIS